ncbi:hypothetical protein [Cytobacillus luteolus]|nr:hypothetical protein [Cytobacillus luteolus]MBP1941901.1 fumarate reductase subunit C [Cytobacillus luteolus]
MKEKKKSKLTLISIFSCIYICLSIITVLIIDSFSFYPNGYHSTLSDDILIITETNFIGMEKEQYSFRITDENVKSLWLLQYKVYEIRNAWVITILFFALLLTFPVSGLVGRYITYLKPFTRLIRPQWVRIYVIISLGILAVNIVEYPQLLKEMENLIRSLS